MLAQYAELRCHKAVHAPRDVELEPDQWADEHREHSESNPVGPQGIRELADHTFLLLQQAVAVER